MEVYLHIHSCALQMLPVFFPYVIFLTLFTSEMLMRHTAMIATIRTVLTKCMAIFISFWGYIVSQEMLKVSILGKKQCSLGMQSHRSRLFNPQLFLKCIYCIFSEVETQTRCVELRNGSRPRNLIWLPHQSIPGPRTISLSWDVCWN